MKARQVATLIVVCVLILGFAPQVSAAPSPKDLTKPVSYPLPTLPEPALLGAPFRVDVGAAADAAGWRFRFKSDLGSASAEAINSTFKDSAWRLYFRVPAALSPDLYDVNIAYTAAGKAVNHTQPRSAWIMKEWPSSLTIAQITDLHEPYGADNVAAFVYEMNLIRPDMVITTGDNVDVETISSAWGYLQDSLSRLDSPSFLVPGNHDHAGAKNEFYRMFGGRNSYVVVLGDFVIVTLDTGDMGYTTLDEIQFAGGVFKKFPGKVKILAFHHPPLSRDVGTHLTTDPGGDLTGDWTTIEKLAPIMHFFWLDTVNGNYVPKPEAKELIRMVQENDVRLIMNGHVHSDMIHVLNGRHYFVTTGTLGGGAVPGMNRGYRVITVTKDGKVTFPVMDPKTMYNPPNLTPVGNIQYWYEGPNDGSTTSSLAVIKNSLDVAVTGNLEFRVSSAKPLSDYKYTGPQPDRLEQATRGGAHVIKAAYSVPAKTTITVSFSAAPDTEKPKIKATLPATYTPETAVPLTIEASDTGLGVKEFKVKYAYVFDSFQRELAASWAPTVGKDATATTYATKTLSLSVPASKGGEITVQVSATDYSGNTETVTLKTDAPLPVTKYGLKVGTSPVQGMQIVVKGQPRVSPFSESVEAGSVTVGVPATATLGGVDYSFKRWSDGEQSSVRTIDLKADTSLEAVYEVVPKKYSLSVASVPEGIQVSVDGAAKTTPSTVQLQEGSHTVSAPSKVTLGGKDYQFKAWSAGAATPEVKVDLKADTSLTATYEAVAPPPQQGGIPLPAEYAVVGVLAALGLLLSKRRQG